MILFITKLFILESKNKCSSWAFFDVVTVTYLLLYITVSAHKEMPLQLIQSSFRSSGFIGFFCGLLIAQLLK